MNDRPATHFIPALTGLRGYAALWVFLSHVSYTDALLRPLGLRAGWQRAAGIIKHEYLAVDVFFMLSGFVLLHVHRSEFAESVRRGDYIRFLALRLARVYPLHILALTLSYLALRAAPDHVGVNDTQTLCLQLALMASWGLRAGISWNLPSWSLSSEWLAYLCFPVIALVAGAAATRRTHLFGIVGLCLVFYLLIFVTPYRLIYDSGPGAQVRVLVGVSIGVLMRALYDDERVRRLPWQGILYAALPLTAATMSEWSGARRPDNIWAYLMMVVVLFATACATGRFMWPLTGRPARYLGEISYAIYIFHYPVMRALRTLFEPQLIDVARHGSAAQVLAALGGTLLAVLAVAALAHHAVEEPFRRWARDRLVQRRATELPPRQRAIPLGTPAASDHL